MNPAAVLCDADGCLFPSEGPAFAASVEITNAFMERIGSKRRFAAEELRLASTGRNFRTTATALALSEGVEIPQAELEDWVRREAEAVTDHLGRVLRGDSAVTAALRVLAAEHELALVTSSALGRIDASLDATGLAEFFPRDRRFSAEDSLGTPTGKPDPAIYAHALASLGLDAGESVAVEDSAPGVESAIRAGISTIGMLAWVPEAERGARARALTAAGARVTVDSWDELPRALAPERPTAELLS